MKDFYFSNHVFATSVKDFEPYLSSPQSGYIQSDGDLLSSQAFKTVFASFFVELRDSDKELASYFEKAFPNAPKGLLSLSLSLLGKPKGEVLKSHPSFKEAMADGGSHYLKLIDSFFHYWLSLARFAYLDDGGENALSSLKPKMLFLRKSVFHIYNSLKAHVYEKELSLETDFSAGFLAGFTTRRIMPVFPKDYKSLERIPFVSAADLNLPYSTTTKRNKRIGVYQPQDENPLFGVTYEPSEWLCLPLKCGTSLVYFYFPYKYAGTVLGLLNLFEKADIVECGRLPDILIVFGGKKGATTGTYYADKKNKVMVGYVSDTDEADYFGYVKKLVLTLHNLRMIEMGALPIHGSMVEITLKGGRKVRVVIMGDSGAGKSESIEAFRLLAKEYLENITVVFDDMGTLFWKEGRITASGTEIGAFVRLDDLDESYAFSHLNDALMFNLGENNARLVYACTPYEEVISPHPIDLFLYANNYEDVPDSLAFFQNYDDLVKVCEEGRRKAKGTTGEVGLVSSYFANPFGPVQEKEKTHKIVKRDFEALAKQGTKLGVIYTKLAVPGHERNGPQEAAKSLLEWIKRNAWKGGVL